MPQPAQDAASIIEFAVPRILAGKRSFKREYMIGMAAASEAPSRNLMNAKTSRDDPLPEAILAVLHNKLAITSNFVLSYF